eukprot:CAMPEP_0201733170 /NCGR_PEP_ID=MMETSP0593-20130828/30807_1 /ASSEMBLY_ACC=CAM_ASM_000672 /TAXON_ID=267983 /ORGANISM="Skeletonema japonicum, Strain CCMP2506" /LENGTH=252 /DNA_ID=CAMNT_0048226269 /DNA_START=26 /DNA_END=784 /DNA_ORIENTATION=+
MSISALRTESSTASKAVLSSGVDTLTSLSAALSTAAPYADISSAESAFVAAIGADVEKSNDVVDGLYTIVRDALVAAIGNIRILEKFIGLRVPQMEDGNNFGVTVQMMMAKLLKDKREQLEKSLSETSKYYSSRADAIDKFNHLSNTSKVETSSESTGKSTGGKDGDSNTTSSNTSCETKTSTASDKIDAHRVKALAALDAQMYCDLKFALEGMVDDYLIILDNFEKNMDKLEHPRGKAYGGYGSGGSSMVY